MMSRCPRRHLPHSGTIAHLDGENLRVQDRELAGRPKGVRAVMASTVITRQARESSVGPQFAGSSSRRRSHAPLREALFLVIVALAGAMTLASCGSHAALTMAQRLNAGLDAYTAGNYTQARSDYEQVIRQDPSNKDGLDQVAWYDLGVLDQKLGNYAAARSDYQQVLLLDPKYVNALYNLAVLEAPKDPSGAISLYQQALVLAPTNPDIPWNLGLLLYAAGDVAQGRKYLKIAIKLDPAIASRLPKNVTL
jgi:tetratricopeptide (TPR) repeat protein